MQGKRLLLMLWLRPQQCCAICCQLVTKTTGWNIHQIVEREKVVVILSNLVLFALIVKGNYM